MTGAGAGAGAGAGEAAPRDLVGRRAIVCGSTQGIGLASARALAARGAAVTLVARDETALAQARASLPTPASAAAGGGAGGHAFLVADFSEPDVVHAAVSGHLRDVGAAHVLVNNTGGPPGGPLIEATAVDLAAPFAQHVLVNQLLVQAVVPGMREAGYGRIINVISTSVKQPIPGLGVSNTIRGAVASWAKTLAGELGPDGITVNNVLPGFTLTGRLRSLIAAKARSQGTSEEDIAAAMKATIPLRRFAEAEEVAAAVAWLASPEAGYVNGINLPVDGGRTGSL